MPGERGTSRRLICGFVLALLATIPVVAAAGQSQGSSAASEADRTSFGPETAEPTDDGQSSPPPRAAGLGLGAALSIKQVTASAVEDAPVLDGDVLGDAAWRAASPATGFRQTAPDEGEPASERTEVRIIYTRDAIYFGVVCYDRDPSSIIVADSRRDSALTDSDSFMVVLDTFSDRQNGFVFGTSPAGQE